MSSDWLTGITWCKPGDNPDHTFRETLAMGHTRCSFQHFTEIMNEMKQEWRGSSYNLFTRNCHHFSDELCFRLGVGRLPPWINDLAGVGDATASLFGKAYNNVSLTGAVQSVTSGLYYTISGVPQCFQGRQKGPIGLVERGQQEEEEEEEQGSMHGKFKEYRLPSSVQAMPSIRGDLVYPAQGEAVLVYHNMSADVSPRREEDFPLGFPAPGEDWQDRQEDEKQVIRPALGQDVDGGRRGPVPGQDGHTREGGVPPLFSGLGQDVTPDEHWQRRVREAVM
eukprot:CAMPEP_0171070504 /NCGR_PEP_ID=MMETSP0766_2-20121228/9787_1 /TAXON_ID=439317 /ORGANISM="Gambierdiscus australes, Strain CAWD 149" /LENGTH=279 /DNA_ID=CAMNT_0011526987 /DNA_START=51 /DNA_END=890 /DNA_ORIENTATION=-